MSYIDKLRYEWGNSTDGSEWVEFLERRLESLFAGEPLYRVRLLNWRRLSAYDIRADGHRSSYYMITGQDSYAMLHVVRFVSTDHGVKPQETEIPISPDRTIEGARLAAQKHFEDVVMGYLEPVYLYGTEVNP